MEDLNFKLLFQRNAFANLYFIHYYFYYLLLFSLLLIFCTVTPPSIALVSLVQLLDFLVIAQWKPIASGKCYVSYNVEFLNNTNQIVYQYNGTNATGISATNSANATSIRIYAVFNGTIGVPFIQNIPPPQTTTTTTTTISTTIKSSTTLGDVYFLSTYLLSCNFCLIIIIVC